MGSGLGQVIGRVAGQLAGWTLLLGGLALIGLGLLCPHQREVASMKRQQALMQDQAKQLADEEAAYQRFHQALATDDPILLERLAYYNLRLKPSGAMPIAARHGSSPFTVMDMPVASGASPMDHLPNVESLLHRPLPNPDEYLAINDGMRTRLDRLSSGLYRLIMLACGVLCLCGAMIPLGTHEQRVGRLTQVPVRFNSEANEQTDGQSVTTRPPSLIQ